MKRSPLPPREKPLARVRLKRPRVVVQKAQGAIVSGDVALPTQKTGKSLKSPAKAKKRKPLRFGGIPQNPAYLNFVRLFDCILSGAIVVDSVGRAACHDCGNGKIEAAHTGPHGRAQKAADETALPMCASAHRTGRFAHHRLGKKFWEFWGLDQSELIQSFNEMARESEVLVQEIK